MKTRSIILIIILIFFISSTYSQQEKKKHISTIVLEVCIIPDSGYIAGNTEIDFPMDSCFLLAKSLKICKIKSNGKEIPYTTKPSELNPSSNEIVLNRKYPNFKIEFSGKIKPEDFSKTISNVNMVGTNLIELANYIDWYPCIKNGKAFNFSLKLDLPADYVPVTNGIMIDQKIKNGRNISKWKQIKPSYGITFLAAPGLKNSSETRNGQTIEIYYTELSRSYVDSMKNDLFKSLQFYKELYRCDGSSNLVRIIYSPRSAGGYARSPLIFVSEMFTLEQINNKFGYARDFRLNAHEIAHYWSKANTQSIDDWINEGVAEYSAYLASDNVIGSDFANLLVKEYEGIVNNTQTQLSILETTGDSWERDINKYYKPTLLFRELDQKYGKEKIKLFFNELYIAFKNNKAANTAILLDIMEKTLGKEARNFFNDGLNRKTWYKQNQVSSLVYNPSDSVFIGKWTGWLTQFGATTKFVLNIKLDDNKLISTLDSPDQDAYNIPTNDLQIDGNYLGFGVGVASASFSGTLSKANMQITGKWTQRGVDYPLILKKE